jgi:hypothetical protein
VLIVDHMPAELRAGVHHGQRRPEQERLGVQERILCFGSVVEPRPVSTPLNLRKADLSVGVTGSAELTGLAGLAGLAG